jgi:hypothetical protein
MKNDLCIIYRAALKNGMKLKIRQVEPNAFVIEDEDGLLEIFINQHTQVVYRNPFDAFQFVAKLDMSDYIASMCINIQEEQDKMFIDCAIDSNLLWSEIK